MKVFTSEDYGMIKSWWEGHDAPVVPEHGLSRTGLIAYSGDKPVAAAWLYSTDSSVAFLEHFVSNPDATNRERSKGMNGLIGAFFGIADELKVSKLFGMVKPKSLVRRSVSAGANIVEENIYLLVRNQDERFIQ